MGREHDVGGLRPGTVSDHRLEPPRRRRRGDRALADPDRTGAPARAPAAAQLAATALVASVGRLPLPLALWLGRRLGDAGYLALRGGFRTAPFRVGRFVLLSSRASKGGGPYVMEEAYPLAA